MLEKKIPKLFWILFVLVLFSQNLIGQRKIEHVRSEILQRDPAIFEGNIFFSGDVVFKHEGTFVYADTVIYFEKENRIIARSNARMNVGDTVSLKAYSMEYDGTIRKAYAKRNVVLKDRTQTLETEQLTYDRNTNKAYFNTRSKIIQEGNIMYSNHGVYDLTQNSTYFDNNVDISTDEYDINGSKLIFNNKTGITKFSGPTTISSKENPKNRIYTEDGTYNTKTEEAYLNKNSRIYSNGKIITGDKMYSNQKTGYAYARGNFELNDPKERRYLKGGYGEYFQEKDSAIVTEKPYIVKAFKKDSLYIAADTIAARRDSAKLSTLYAYRKVRAYKTDMQAKCDSLHFKESLGEMHFFHDPVFWNSYRQITGDTIVAYSNVKAERMDSIHVKSNAFAISKTDSLTVSDFNQVKGRFMMGLIDQEELRYIKVKGNAENIVFIDDEDPDTGVVSRFGINKSTCGIIEADFYERIVNIVECNINGQGKVYPVSMLPANNRYLADFVWRSKERPKRWQDIFLDIPASSVDDFSPLEQSKPKDPSETEKEVKDSEIQEKENMDLLKTVEKS